MSIDIKRRAALRACFYALKAAKQDGKTYEETWECLKEKINRLPYKEVKNANVAHWELDESCVSVEKKRYICTKCGWWLYVKRKDNRGLRWARYCPSCGAKMQGGTE